jgi:vitamin B12 transporter
VVSRGACRPRGAGRASPVAAAFVAPPNRSSSPPRAHRSPRRRFATPWSITREDIEASGALSLGEVLERRAGIQLRATGGPGQPQGLFIRGAGTAQTLVLVDGLRVSSATVGTTSIENIPLELIERIEVVKGPLSSLYGSDAIGGVVQVFTRGADVPHFFGTAAYGTDNDARLSTGLVAVDERSSPLDFGRRAQGRRAERHERARVLPRPGPRPHENAFANLHTSYRMWQDELVSLDAFVTHGANDFDGCGTATTATTRRSRARSSPLEALHPVVVEPLHARLRRRQDRTRGAFPSRFETAQDQATWINR